MNPWRTLDELPTIGQRVLVAAWEFGCTPVYALCVFWQSTWPGQPPKFYLDESYRLGHPNEIAQRVRLWMPIPELPKEGGGV